MMVKVIKNLREQKKSEIKQRLKFNGYKNCLISNEIISKSQQRFKSETRNVYTEEIYKIA